ncbi:MAG: hypothetical protein ACJ734_03280 [Gaiellaceae bacterium]
MHPNVRPLQPQRTGAVLAARTVADGTTANSPFVLISLALAIACFGLASPPAAHVRWHGVAVLTRYRPRELTLAGALLLVLAAVAIVLEGR